MNIVLPKTLIDLDKHPGRRLYFLAGPVRGAGDWQQSLARTLMLRDTQCLIAIPQRYAHDHAFQSCLVDGTPNVFERQLGWEEHYLTAASTSGGIIFWLGCQKEPRDDADPYAMDTRRELGEWLTRAQIQGAKVFLGAEEGFPGLSQIERTAHRLLGPLFVIHRTIPDLAQAALQR